MESSPGLRGWLKLATCTDEKVFILVRETFARHPGMGDGDLPVGTVQDLVDGSWVIVAVAYHGVGIHVLLVQAGYDFRHIVVVLL